MLSSITTQHSSLLIIDQLVLPHSTNFIPINNPQQAHNAIKSMQVPSSPSKSPSHPQSQTDTRCTRHRVPRCTLSRTPPHRRTRPVAPAPLSRIHTCTQGSHHPNPRFALLCPPNRSQPRCSNSPPLTHTRCRSRRGDRPPYSCPAARRRGTSRR
jgi:hypothetical protein